MAPEVPLFHATLAYAYAMKGMYAQAVREQEKLGSEGIAVKADKGDLRVQVTKALENLKIALTAAGATMEDLIKVNYYVVNLKPEQVPIIREVRSKYFSAEHAPASTLVGVTA